MRKDKAYFWTYIYFIFALHEPLQDGAFSSAMPPTLSASFRWTNPAFSEGQLQNAFRTYQQFEENGMTVCHGPMAAAISMILASKVSGHGAI